MNRELHEDPRARNLVKKEAHVRRGRLMKTGQLDQEWYSTKAETLKSEESLLKKGVQLSLGGLIKKEA